MAEEDADGVHGDLKGQSNYVNLKHQQLKTDWYEKDDIVTVCLYIKDISKENIKVKFEESSVEIQFRTKCSKFLQTHGKGSAENSTFLWKLNLAHEIRKDRCTFKVFGTKLELKLKKESGKKWTYLEKDDQSADEKKKSNITEPAITPKPAKIEQNLKEKESKKAAKPTERQTSTEELIAQPKACDDVEKQLIDQWKSGAYCDAVFRVGQEVVSAHKCVLCAASSYFDELFSESMMGETPEVMDLSEAFDSAAVLRDLIAFIYGEEIEITQVKLEGLLKGSTLTHLGELTEHCVHFLLENLQLENCLWTWNLAEKFTLREVDRICLDLAQTRFKDAISHKEGIYHLSSDALCGFMKKGMIKYCTKQDLQDFIKRYFINNTELTSEQKQVLLDLTGLEYGDIMEDDLHVNKTDQNTKMENMSDRGDQKSGESKKNEVDSEPLITEDVVLIQLETQQQWFIYRTKTDEWLTLPETFASIRYPEERICVLGGGSDNDLLVILGIEDTKWVNINNFQIGDIAESPLMGHEKNAIETERLKFMYRCHEGELCCVVYSRIVIERKVGPKKKKKGASQHKEDEWMSNLQGMYDTGRMETVEMFYVYVQRYNFQKKRWKFDCQVYCGTDSFIRMVCLEEDNGRMYIVLCGMKDIRLYKYNPEERKVTNLSSYTDPNLMLAREALIFSRENSVVLSSELYKETVLYDIKSDRWSFMKNFQTRPSDTSFASVSENEGWMYVFKKGVTTKSTRFLKYNPFTKQLKELCPLPGIPFDQRQKANNQRVPTKTLAKLVPVRNLSNMTEPLLSGSEVDKAMNRYRNQANLTSKEEPLTESGEEADNDWETDEEEEEDDEEVNHIPFPGLFAHQQAMAEQQMFQEAMFREALMRRMFSPF